MSTQPGAAIERYRHPWVQLIAARRKRNACSCESQPLLNEADLGSDEVETITAVGPSDLGVAETLELRYLPD